MCPFTTPVRLTNPAAASKSGAMPVSPKLNPSLRPVRSQVAWVRVPRWKPALSWIHEATPCSSTK